MYDLKYVVLRYFNVYGPRMDMHGAYTEVMIRWMEKLYQNEVPIIFGDGTDTMDFVHVEDIAKANILALLSNISDIAINIGTGVETSLNELASFLIDAFGQNANPKYASARKVNPVSKRIADTSMAKKYLGFSAEFDIKEGLKSLVDWWINAREQMDAHKTD